MCILHHSSPCPRHRNELEAYMPNFCHNLSIVAMTATWFADITVDTYSLQCNTHEYEYRKTGVKEGYN